MSSRKGKIRSVHVNSDKTRVALICSDRISAFDNVLPRDIPGKGVVLTDIAWRAFQQTRDVCPNWVLSRPSSRITYGIYCKPFPIEVIVRAYLVGSAWRAYKAGTRDLCGHMLPDGLEEGHRFEPPIVTPTTKDHHHDENVTPSEIVARGLASQEEWNQIRRYAQGLFARGTKIAENRDLVLVDTKYEFGMDKYGTIRLIDEVHTPDSSRYWQIDPKNSKKKTLLSKEFARQWILAKGAEVADTEEFVHYVRKCYETLYVTLTGRSIHDAKGGPQLLGEDENAILMHIMAHGHRGM